MSVSGATLCHVAEKPLRRIPNMVGAFLRCMEYPICAVSSEMSCSPHACGPGWQNPQSTSFLLFVRLEPSWLMMTILPSLLHLSMANPWTLSWKVPFLVWKSYTVWDGRGLDNYLHGNPLQYSCLENPMNRGDWQATAQGVGKSQTRLSMNAHTLPYTHF